MNEIITTATAEGTAGVNNATAAGNQPGQGTNSGANDNVPANANEPKTYTEKDFQSEVDKRVTEALKTANTKAQADFETKMKEAREQWEKESKMSADERAKAEQEKAKKQFEKERAEFERGKLEFEAIKGLAAEGLPVDFAKMLCGADTEETNANIKAFAQQYNASVKKSVEEQLKGKPPKSGGEPNGADPFLAGFGK